MKSEGETGEAEEGRLAEVQKDLKLGVLFLAHLARDLSPDVEKVHENGGR